MLINATRMARTNRLRLKRYPRLYTNNAELSQAMAHFYRHIFLFCKKARVALGEGEGKKNKSKQSVIYVDLERRVF